MVISFEPITNQLSEINQRLINLERFFSAQTSTVEQPEQERLLTKIGAAKILDVSPSTIDNMRRAGQLERVMVRGSVRFRYADVNAILNKKNKGK